jgi:2-dehydro-3-deoxyphosphogluconate aldolase/(4S)-4-hydroxy-2-oxoglutarate aldolase
MPWSLLMVTGGVQPTRESVRSWIDAGAACVGLGSQLFPHSAIASADWSSISARIAEALAYLRNPPASPKP